MVPHVKVYDRICSRCARVDRIIDGPQGLTADDQGGECPHCRAIFCVNCLRVHKGEGQAAPFDGKRILTCTVCGRASFAHHCPSGCPGGQFTPLSAPAPEAIYA